MAAPITQFREAIRAVVEDAFADEIAAGMPVRNDKLHGSLGSSGPVVGIAPEREGATTIAITNAMQVTVQFYGRYDLQINPEQTVDPATVEEQAFRLQQATERVNGGPAQAGIWFFNLTDIEYPDDPTGNKTRFEATFEGYGQNPSHIETIGA